MIYIAQVPENAISEEVRQFLREHVRSIEQLEIMLLLGGSPERTWTATEVYQVVLSSEASVQNTLDLLCQQGLLSKPDSGFPCYQFTPRTDAIRSTVAQLAQVYRHMPVRVVEAIYGERGSALDEFSNAFRWRKDP